MVINLDIRSLFMIARFRGFPLFPLLGYLACFGVRLHVMHMLQLHFTKLIETQSMLLNWLTPLASFIWKALDSMMHHKSRSLERRRSPLSPFWISS